MWGSDQAASVEPWGFMRLVRDIRVIEQALGDGVKRVYESEMSARAKLRRKQVRMEGEEVDLLLENLPPHPWCFEGQWYNNNFVDAQEIANFCEERNLKMTYNISHAQLQCNYIGSDLITHLRTLELYIAHIHDLVVQKTIDITMICEIRD